MRVTASAPGKVVICGEYAVLDGAPAICMAVDRRARVTIVSSDADHHTVRAPGHTATTGRFRAEEDGVVWLEDGEDFVLLQQVWREAGLRPKERLAITIDTCDFVHEESGIKLGLGSSAAVSVALAAALVDVGDIDCDATRMAFDAHHRFQDGMGSGVDIACSASGGLVEYTASGRLMRPLEWPGGLAYGVIWVGVSASTRQRLAQLEHQVNHVSRAALVLASRRMATAWSSGSAQSVLDGYPDYIGVLREFSVDHDLGIFDAGHADLTDMAAKAGLVYKPCGAGGGDTGIVLAMEQDAIDEFLGKAKSMGMHPVELGLDMDGTRVERESP